MDSKVSPPACPWYARVRGQGLDRLDRSAESGFAASGGPNDRELHSMPKRAARKKTGNQTAAAEGRTSLDTLRTAIDDLDRRILELLAECAE